MVAVYNAHNTRQQQSSHVFGRKCPLQSIHMDFLYYDNSSQYYIRPLHDAILLLCEMRCVIFRPTDILPSLSIEAGHETDEQHMTVPVSGLDVLMLTSEVQRLQDVISILTDRATNSQDNHCKVYKYACMFQFTCYSWYYARQAM